MISRGMKRMRWNLYLVLSATVGFAFVAESFASAPSAAAGANGGGAASVEITPDYAIVVPDARPDDVPKHLAAVARELAHDIEESTGMRLPVVSAKDARPNAKCIYIGETFAEREGLLPKDRPLENFDSAVAEKDGSVYLFGHDRTRFADPGRKAQWWR